MTGQTFLQVFSQSKIFSGAFGTSQFGPKNFFGAFGASNNSGSPWGGGGAQPTPPPFGPPPLHQNSATSSCIAGQHLHCSHRLATRVKQAPHTPCPPADTPAPAQRRRGLLCIRASGDCCVIQETHPRTNIMPECHPPRPSLVLIVYEMQPADLSLQSSHHCLLQPTAIVPHAHWEAHGRGSLPLHHLVSDSANPHNVSHPLPQPLRGYLEYCEVSRLHQLILTSCLNGQGQQNDDGGADYDVPLHDHSSIIPGKIPPPRLPETIWSDHHIHYNTSGPIVSLSSCILATGRSIAV